MVGAMVSDYSRDSVVQIFDLLYISREELPLLKYFESEVILNIARPKTWMSVK